MLNTDGGNCERVVKENECELILMISLKSLIRNEIKSTLTNTICFHFSPALPPPASAATTTSITAAGAADSAAVFGTAAGSIYRRTKGQLLEG